MNKYTLNKMSFPIFILVSTLISTICSTLNAQNGKGLQNSKIKSVLKTDFESLDDVFKLSLQIGAFKSIIVNVNLNHQLTNLNPLNDHNSSSSDDDTVMQFYDPMFIAYKNQEEYLYLLQGLQASKNFNQIYLSKRTLETDYPIDLLNKVDFKNPLIQNQLLKKVTFSSCIESICRSSINTLLGPANYSSFYQFFDQNQLASNGIFIPDELIDKSSKSNIHSAILQYAFNWSNFFTTAFNLILFTKNQNNKLKIISYQIFLTSPDGIVRFIPNLLFKTKISSDIDDQIKDVNSFFQSLTNKN